MVIILIKIKYFSLDVGPIIYIVGFQGCLEWFLTKSTMSKTVGFGLGIRRLKNVYEKGSLSIEVK